MVSLTTDRGENGYRQLVNVLSDDEMRETLMSDAKKEMAWFKKKYAILTELAPVFTAIEAVS